MIVLDASVLIDLVLDTPSVADALRTRLLVDPRGLSAPHLIDVEVGQVLRRFVLGGRLDTGRAEAALEDLADFPLRRYPLTPLLLRAFALRENFTMYDAVYIALAEGLDATLVTRDRALSATKGHHAKVEVV